MLLASVYHVIGERLRRAILALAELAVRSHRNISSEYYRFPPF